MTGIWPKIWNTYIWDQETDGGQVQKFAARESMDNSEQAKRRANLLFSGQAGGAPWGLAEPLNLHIDVLAQNGERDMPIILLTLRNDDDVEG